MPFLTKIKVCLTLLAFGVSFVAADTPKSGKVRLVIGEVQFQKKGVGDWNLLRVNGKVQEKDKIKTFQESTVSIAMPDGSIVAVSENSEVEFSQLLFVDGSQTTLLDIKSGQLRFDVQKQKGAKSAFKFRTPTGTASIRGTDGVVGVTSAGQSVGALNSGAMDMEQDGVTVSVQPQQFVAMRKGKAPIVIAAKNAGDPDFVKNISAVVDDTTKSDADILAEAQSLDSKIEQKKESLRAKYNCKFGEIPAVVETNEMTIDATCSAGMDVSIGAETIKSTGEPIQFHPEWSLGATGDKKFVVNCTAEGTTFECARLSTTYKLNRVVTLGAVDEQACTVAYTTRGFEDNKGSLKLFMDDSLLQDLALDKDSAGVLKLVTGTHNYVVTAENEDPKVGVVTKRISCFPATEVGIDFKGGSKEVIRKKVSQGSAAYPEMVFTLKNVPNNDPAQLQSVEVKIDGRNYTTQYTPAKDGIGYRCTIRAPRGKTTTVTVVVTLKNGQAYSAAKSYEFK